MKPRVERDTAVLLAIAAMGVLALTAASYREHQGNSPALAVVAVLEFVLLGLAYLVVIAYIRERRRTQQAAEATNLELAARNREVERAHRLKSQFLANMSHELRTPLNAILGFSELLEEQTAGALNEKQQRWIGHVRTAARHLLRLINDVLDLSKIEAGHLALQVEEFPIGDTLPEVLSVIKPVAMTRKVAINSRVDGSIVVRGDRVRVKQVLYNLLSNAVKFTPSGGKVEVSCTVASDRAVITVSDSGPGIAFEDQEAIFEEFRQLPDSPEPGHEGTGLGLAISRRLVEQQNGHLWVQSAPGEGSRFSFSLPLGHSIALSPPLIPRVVRQSRRARPLILVVDDEASALELLRTSLLPDYEIVTASSAAQAVRLAREIQPDLVTLDILMPTGTGWAVLAQMKSDSAISSIPIIVVSIVDRKELGFLLGASEYLVKPVNREQLLESVRRHVVPGTERTGNVVVVKPLAGD